MVRPDALGNPELGTQERGTDLGDELLGCIGLIAEALAHLAVQPVGGSGPMHQFVDQCGVVAFVAGHGFRTGEKPLGRHLDTVRGTVEVRAITTMLNPGPSGTHEPVGTLKPGDRAQVLDLFGQHVAIDLGGIEHGRSACHPALAIIALSRVGPSNSL